MPHIRFPDFQKPPGWRVIAGFILLFVAVWLGTVFLSVVPNFILRRVGGTLSRGGMLLMTVWLSAWMLHKVSGLRWSVSLRRPYMNWQ